MVIGHKTQLEFLKKISGSDRIPQAMLFSGNEHLGKRKVAMEFAKFLNCDSLDIYLVEPEKGEIGVDAIRELKKNLVLQPIKSNFKIGLIDNADCMNKNAQNCLLKTLEEPRNGVILILISSKPRVMASTLISRMQTLRFYPLKTSDIQ